VEILSEIQQNDVREFAKLIYELLKLIYSNMEKNILYLKENYEKSNILRILIGDLNKYETIIKKSYEQKSILILAKNLNEFIQFMDKFCFDNKGKIKITKQYKQDLNELNWLLEESESEKYQKFNIYFGKIVEFLVAQYFLKQGYKITNMQAWDTTSPDIVIEKNNNKMNIEVKWIGQYKQSFENSLKGQNNGFIDNGSASNNLICKINKAGNYFCKKNGLDGGRIAAIIIYQTSFGDYFIGQETCCETEEEVIDYQKIIYNIPNIDEIHIFRLNGLQLEHFYTFDIKNKKFYN
jgi:hypothetical protein